MKLVAMADVFESRLKGSYNAIKNSEVGKNVEVNDDSKFLGFEAYKQAMDKLRPGDIVILTTPPAFRWVQFTYAISKGLNVFMEKPVTVDGPSSRRMLKLYDQSVEKKLKVGVGLMCRHCVVRKELFQKIKDGAIGDINLLRGYRMSGPIASCRTKKKPADQSEVLFQIQNFHSFLWASGGGFSDYYIHNIDECCWMKDAWPVKAQASGGRHYREDYVDQNFDAYSVEYTFADGAKLFMNADFKPVANRNSPAMLMAAKVSPSSLLKVMPHRMLASTAVNKSKRKTWSGLACQRAESLSFGMGRSGRAILKDLPYNEVNVALKPVWSPRWVVMRHIPAKKSLTTRC